MKKEIKFDLFCFNNDYTSKYFDKNYQFDVKKKKISSFNLVIPGEKISIKEKICRCLFCLFSKENVELWYVERDGIIAHKSLCVSKCKKYSFTSNEDYVIGPCYTHPKFRGMGLYPSVIASIVNEKTQSGSLEIYMIIADSNVASINGVKKVGFEKVGKVAKRRLGVYKRVE